MMSITSDYQLVNLHDIDSENVTKTCRGPTGLVLSARRSDDESSNLFRTMDVSKSWTAPMQTSTIIRNVKLT